MLYKKNIKAGRIKIYFISFLILITLNFTTTVFGSNSGKIVVIKILDKVNSKNSTLKINIGEEVKFNNLLIRPMKCKNSEFDDDPEITAYLQVTDLTLIDKDKVFIFNDWTFSSSPSLKPFDHPIYDIWLTKCID
tara:strand:+ start:1345 stop:1749 length:405 start_codon:yes stop_codon:yes gene_type:complete